MRADINVVCIVVTSGSIERAKSNNYLRFQHLSFPDLNIMEKNYADGETQVPVSKYTGLKTKKVTNNDKLHVLSFKNTKYIIIATNYYYKKY